MVAVWLVRLLVMLAIGAVAPARAAPRTPANDAEVVESLPGKADPALLQLAALRRGLQQSGASDRVVLDLARRDIEAARRTGDPRWLGQAQSLLRRWDSAAPASTAATSATLHEALVLRATVLQSLHQFDAALGELARALATDPLDPQALLVQATVLQVRGRYTEARRDCALVTRRGGDAPATICLASIAAVTGQSESAQRLLQNLVRTLPVAEPALRLWSYTLLAEIAMRHGDTTLASSAFAAAMQTDSHDRYLLATYCDFLLEQRAPARVLTLTDGAGADDNLLLRRVLALAALRDPALNVAREELAARYAAQHARGDATHLREEARFRLLVLQDAAGALQLAQQNWRQQREPADVRILLEAARAARSRADEEVANQWLRQVALEDRHLQVGVRS